MPLYDLRCSGECGVVEAVIPLSQIDNPTFCPECTMPAARIVSPVTTVGAVFDKKIEFGQLGKKFSTNSEFRQYKKDHPEARFVDKNSTEWRGHYDQVRNHCDKKSKKQGFRDHEDRISKLSKRKREMQERTN
tara:strand:+ start:59 stop:457 length:399 start_codon:yes stop_codon:yes gene_type:complete